MKKYAYERLHIGRIFSSKVENYRGIIDDYAKRGYRYVGYIPINIEAYGRIVELDLIFETDDDF